MKTLRDQLASMEQRWKKTRFWRAAGITVVLLLVVIAVAAAVDYFFALNMMQRKLLTAAMYGSVVLYAMFGWWLPYLRRTKPEKVAWMLEDAVPSFNEKLISAVELTAKKEGVEQKALSMDMIEHVLGDARLDLASVEPKRVFPISWNVFLWPLLLLILFLTALFIPQLQFKQLVMRVAFPSDQQATVGEFGLFLDAPESGARPEGDPIEFVVECSSPDVASVQLCISDERTRKFPMSFDKDRSRWVYTFGDSRQSFRFWAQSGDVLSAKREMDILRRPKIEELQLDYEFPAYTGIEKVEGIPSSNGAMKGFKGTKVALTVTASKPLAAMTMNWLGDETEIPLDEIGTQGQIDRVIERSGVYSIRLEDKDGLANLHEIEFAVDAMEDTPPSITLLTPEGDMHVGIADVLSLEWEMEDDFGIDKAELVIVRAQEAPSNIPLDTGMSTFEWDLDENGLRRGENVSYFVRVTDAVGQTDVTEPRSLSLLSSYQLEQAARFSDAAEEGFQTLEGLKKPLANADRVRRLISEARGLDEDDLPHNRAMLGKQAGQIGSELSAARESAFIMKDNGFFKFSRYASDLLSQVIEQDRVRSLRRLVTPEQGEQGMEDLRGGRDLGARVLNELRKKAREHVPVIELNVMRSNLDADSNLESRQRLAVRSRELAKAHRPDAVEKFGLNDSAKDLGEKMVWLRNELKRKANDTKTLEALIQEMEDRLTSSAEELASLQERLDMFNREADWSEVAAIAEAYAAQAEMSPDMQEQEDLRLAAELLQMATEERDTETVEAVAQAMPRIEAANEFRVLENQLSEARQDAAKMRDAARAEYAEPGEPQLPSEAELAEMQATLDALQESTLEGEPMHENKVGAEIHKQLSEAERRLPNVEESVEQEDAAKTQSNLTAIEQDLSEAEQLASEQAQRLEREAEAAREQLAKLGDSPVERMEHMQEALSTATAQLATEPELAEANIERVADELADLAADLERAARQEISNEQGDLQAAREEMALAEQLRDVQAETVAPAQAALEAGQTPEAELQTAMEDLAVAKDLLERREMAEGMELSMTEREALQAELQDLAESKLDPALLETLDRLEQLRRNSEQADMLAETAMNLEKRHLDYKARQLAEDVSELRAELGETLLEDGEEAFVVQAEQVIGAAQAETEDLLTEARAMRADMREADIPKLSNAERKEIAEGLEALAEQADSLEQDLARADAVRELMNPEASATPSMQEQFAEQAVDALEGAAERLARKRNPSDELEAAIEGIKTAEKALAETGEQLMAEANREAGMSPELAALVEDLAKEAAAERAEAAEANTDKLDRNGLSERLAQMKDRMTEAHAASDTLDELEEKALPLKQEAAKTLDGIERDLLDEREQANLEKLIEGLADPKKNLWDAANHLDQAAGMVYDTSEPLSGALKEQAKELREDAKGLVSPMDHLRGHEANMKKGLTDLGNQVKRDLQRTDHPLAESASETIEQMQENLTADDLHAADRNLAALEEDLMGLVGGESAGESAGESKGEAEKEMAAVPTEEQIEAAVESAVAATEERAAPRESISPEDLLAEEPAFAEAANPEIDLQIRKGLVEAASLAMEEPEVNAPREAAREAAEGELESAANLAPVPASQTFAEAAELEAAEAAKEELAAGDALAAAPVLDRNPLQPEEEAKLAEQAIENRAGLVADAQEAAEALAEVAKDVEAALTDKNATPNEEMIEHLKAAVDELEARRDALGVRDHEAFEAMTDLEDAVTAMNEAEENHSAEAKTGLQALKEATADIEKQLTAEKERQQSYDDLQKLAGDLEHATAMAEANPEDAKAAKKAKQAAEAFQEAAEKRAEEGGLLSEMAAEAATEAAEAQGTEAAREAVEAALAAVEKLNPAKESKVAPNEDALEALAGADALDNEAALEKALVGDYQGAQEEMETQAEALQGAAKEAAEHAAKEFAAAREAQMEALDEKLEDELDDAEALEEKAGPVAGEKIADAADAARAGDLLGASELMSEALAAADDLGKAEIEQLKEADNAIREAAKKLAAKEPADSSGGSDDSAAGRLAEAASEQAEAAIKELKERVGKTEEGEQAEALSALEEAAEAAANQQLEEAAKALGEAADSLPPELAKAANAAKENAEAAQAITAPAKAGEAAAESALETVKALAEQTDDPLALNQLAEAAEAASSGDLEALGQELAEAQLALPLDLAAEAGEARAGVESAQEEMKMAGDAALSETAMEAIESLEKPVPQALQAAMEQDYQGAMEAARRAGQREAAQKFAEAVQEQVEALSPSAREGLEKLEQAMKAAPDSERAALAEAAKAARRGAVMEAAEKALEAIQPREAQVAVAEHLAEAAAFKDETEAPLAEAQKDADRNQFQQAAMHAAETEHESVAEALSAAEDAAQAAARQAFEDSFQQAESGPRQRLAEAARKMMEGKPEEANRAAQRAGEAGKETLEAIAGAQEAAQEAKAALAEAVKQGTEGNDSVEAAKQGMQNARQSAEAAKQQALQDQRESRANSQALKQAADALRKRDLDRAETLAEQAGANELAEAIGELDPENAKLPAGRHESAKLAMEAQAMARAEDQEFREAQLAQRKAQEAQNLLNQTQNWMNQRKFEQGANTARQAAQGALEAKEAAKAFAEAAAQEQAAADLVAQAQEDARNARSAMAAMAAMAAEPAQPTAQTSAQGSPVLDQSAEPSASPAEPLQAASTSSPSPSQPVENGESGETGETAQGQQATRPAGQGEGPSPASTPSEQGASASERASESSPSLPGSPSQQNSQQRGQLQSGNPVPLPAAEMTEALMDLGAAEAGLSDREEIAQSADNLERAADTLATAAEQMAQQALGQLPTQQASIPSEFGSATTPSPSPSAAQTPGSQSSENGESGEAGESGQASQQPQPGQPGQQPGSGEGPDGSSQGNQAVQAADVSGIKKGTIGDAWEGASGELRSDDKTTRKEQYNDYYRKANQQYLQQLKKKSKR